MQHGAGEVSKSGTRKGNMHSRYLNTCTIPRATAVQLQASIRAVRGALSTLAVIPGLLSGQLGLVRWGFGGFSRLAAATARRAIEIPASTHQFFFSSGGYGSLSWSASARQPRAIR